jgi:predicted MFS family arabinose efflux permease
VRIPDFRSLWTQHTLLNLSEAMKALALSVLIFDRTGSPLLSAIAFLAGFLPQALSSTTVLSFADRLPPRATLFCWDLVRAASAAVFAADRLPVAGMLTLALAYGLFAPVPSAMKAALLVEIVDTRRFVVGQSLFNATIGVTQITGYAVGGGLLALLSPSGILWVVTGMALLSALVVRLGLSARPARQSRSSNASHLAAITATWRVNRTLLADTRTRRLLLAQWLPASCIVGAEALAVSYADEIGSPSAAGALLTSAAIGMLVGDVLVGRFVSQQVRVRWALALALLLAGPYLLYMLRPGIVVAAAAAGLASVGFSYTLSLQLPFIEAVPAAARGQALGVAGSGLMTCQGVAAGLAGMVAEASRPSMAIGAAAVASILCTAFLAGVLRPARRRAR